MWPGWQTCSLGRQIHNGTYLTLIRTLTTALTLLTLTVTVNGNPNPTTKYHCELFNLNCIFTRKKSWQSCRSGCLIHTSTYLTLSLTLTITLTLLTLTVTVRVTLTLLTLILVPLWIRHPLLQDSRKATGLHRVKFESTRLQFKSRVQR